MSLKKFGAAIATSLVMATTANAQNTNPPAIQAVFDLTRADVLEACKFNPEVMKMHNIECEVSKDGGLTNSVARQVKFQRGTITRHGLSITIPTREPDKQGADPRDGRRYQEWGIADAKGLQGSGTRVWAHGGTLQGTFKDNELISGIIINEEHNYASIGTHDKGIKVGKEIYHDGRYEYGLFELGRLIDGFRRNKNGKEIEYKDGKEYTYTERTESRIATLTTLYTTAVQKEFSAISKSKTDINKGIYVASDVSKIPFEFVMYNPITKHIMSLCTLPDPQNQRVSRLYHTPEPDGSRKVTILGFNGQIIAGLTYTNSGILDESKSIYEKEWVGYIKQLTRNPPTPK